MDFIKKLLLILALVLTTLSLGEVCLAQQIHARNSQSTISASHTFRKDTINNKNNEFSYDLINNHQTTLSTRRNNDNQTGNSNSETANLTKQNENLISYIYQQSYLENNSELALLFLLFQMQPNAP